MGLPKSIEIRAILGEEFDKLLDKLGVRDDFVAGKYKCHICGEPIGVNNVRVVFPLSENEVGFVCEKPECVIGYKLTLEC